MTRRRRVLAMLPAGVSACLVAGAPASAQTDATAPVQSLLDGLRAIGQAGGTPFGQREATLTPIVQRAFALDVILRGVVGARLAELQASEQAALLEAFTGYTVANYVANFSSPATRFTLQPGSRAVGADQVVTTQIVPPSGSPTRIDYQVRGTPQGARIVDVLLDGSISQVAVQRSDFRRLLAGGSAQPLIESLRRKIVALRGGG